MMNQQFYLLQELSQDIDSSFFEKIVSQLSETHKPQIVEKGEYLFRQGMWSDKIYFVLDGQIKVGGYNHRGEKITKAFLRKGEIIGELSLKKNVKHKNFAKTSKKTRVLVLTVMEYKELLKSNPIFSLFLINILYSKFQQLDNLLDAVVYKKSRTRIIEFLINLTKTKGQRVGYEFLVRDFFRHKEIGDMTATSRQTVTTVLNELKNKNILTFDYRRLLIRDMNLLIQEINQN